MPDELMTNARLLCLLPYLLFLPLFFYLIVKMSTVYRKYSTRKKYLGNIPRVPSYPLIGNSIFYEKLIPPGAKMFYALLGATNLFFKEGIYCVWLGWIPIVHIYSAKNIETLLGSNKEIEKSDDYRIFDIWLGTGLITSKGSLWKNRRKLLTPTFHFRILDEFQPVFEKHSRVLVKKISELLDEDYLEVVPFLTLCTLDIILETAMGIQTSSQETGTSPFMESIEKVTSTFLKRITKPWLWIDTVFYLLPIGRDYRKNVKQLHHLSQTIIHKRKQELLSTNYSENNRKNKAFLDLLLEEHFKNEHFTELDICYEVNTFTFAGHDTTKIAMSWCLMLLGHHPEVQEKIFHELQDVLGKDYAVEIEPVHLKSFKYLECVIKESQRLYPSIPFLARELKDELIIGDKYRVPDGIRCVVNVSRLHRDEDVFPNPESFVPERFSTEGVKGRSPYAYIPFSAGPRNCIGQRFALAEMKTIVANLVRSFTWISLDHRDKILVLPEIVGRPYPGIRLKFTRRIM